MMDFTHYGSNAGMYASTNTETCWKCNGSGKFEFRDGRTGDCFACEGSGQAARKAPQRAQAPAAAPAASSSGLDLSALPEGRYAVPSGGTRLKVKIDKPADGKWAGFIFVKDAAEYGQGRRYGTQSPGRPYRGQIELELSLILANPGEAMRAYGRLVGKCGACGRHLEDEESVARGIGPICAERLGY